MLDVDLLYRQHLTDGDLRLLDGASDALPTAAALGSPAVEAAVFGTGPAGRGVDGGLETSLSPFLVFAVAVHRTAANLETATWVEERWAPRVRIPLFDVDPLRQLLADPLRRYFLVELLASYTRVTSGVTWVRQGERWRRRRFSELDPLRLAGLLEVVDAGERPGVYRRLGDLALFLCGVFPDRPYVPIGAAHDRLLRLSGVTARRGDDALQGPGLLAVLGARWYAAAVAAAKGAGYPVTTTLEVAGQMGSHFDEARRVLNVVTDRYLFPLRSQWFGS